jgi:hypothetical protein
MLAVVLVLGALLGACGTDSPSGKTVTTVSGVVTAGTPTVGLKTCTSCHPTETSHWMLTRHANVEPTGNLYSQGNPTLGQISTCTKNCHDSNGDGAGNSFTAGYTGNVPRPVVGCESCHSGGQMHVAQGGVGPISYATATTMVIGATSTLVASAQFRTCTGCHELLDPTDPGGTVATTPTHSTVAPTGNSYTITDTHFATPGTWSNASGASSIVTIAGYAMNYADEKVCSNCHNPHKTADTNREWAASRHADRDGAKAWSEYNWSCNGSSATGCGVGTTGNNDRRPCQRCHTTTGYTKFNMALAAGDNATTQQIDAGLLSLVTYTSGFKPEMLECNGCHSDNRGTLRNPGAYTADYTLGNHSNPDSVAKFAFPDMSSSNVCVTCHSARQSGDTIKNVTFTGPTVTTFSNMSFVDSHYLGAAGTIYRATGYTFGRNYSDPASYRHKDVGSEAAPNTGSGGPCVGCHMYRTGSPANHLFSVVGKDSAGTIVSVVSEVCYNCHAGSSSGLADVVEKERVEFEEALSALMVVLDKKGISYNAAAFPYVYKQRITGAGASVISGSPVVTGLTTAGTATTDFFRIELDGTAYGIQSVDSATQITLKTNYTGNTGTGAYVIFRGTRTDGVKNWLFGGSEAAGQNNHGAAFNLQLLVHDPGAYVHNSRYTKRLIYDSIDWADDGLLNYSTGATLNALPAAANYKAEAMLYLLPNGYIPGNVQAERP